MYCDTPYGTTTEYTTEYRVQSTPDTAEQQVGVWSEVLGIQWGWLFYFINGTGPWLQPLLTTVYS